MTQHAAQYAPSRAVLSANTPARALRPAPDSDGKLLDGVAAQDALVALFDEFADEEPPEAACRGVIRLFRHNVAPAQATARDIK